jgi:hypothetical protein
MMFTATDEELHQLPIRLFQYDGKWAGIVCVQLSRESRQAKQQAHQALDIFLGVKRADLVWQLLVS